MKKRKFIILAIAIITVAFLTLKYINDKNSDQTAKVLLDRVITMLDKNDESEEALIKSLKNDYIVRAKAVSFWAHHWLCGFMYCHLCDNSTY